MRFGYSERCLEHDTGPRHPETPDRLRAIRQTLQGCHGVEYVDASAADRDAVERVHDVGYVDDLQAFCADGGGDWDLDTAAVGATWVAALQSAGLAIWSAERALAGDCGRDTPFALGRPPGHHAVADDAMGFCFLNNVAIAAEAVLSPGGAAADAGVDSDGDAADTAKGGDAATAIDTVDADRVAVVDWDVHHGNGTADVFYDRGDVFVTSIHEDGLYPGTGDVDETGANGGEGTTMNVPVPAGAGDVDYTEALDRVVLPAIRDFDPDLVLVSAGFDAHRHDPISRTRVSTEGYGTLASRVRAAAADADAGVAFVLEGGYGLDTLSESVAMVHEVFDGYEPVPPEGDLESKTVPVLDRLAEEHPALQ